MDQLGSTQRTNHSFHIRDTSHHGVKKPDITELNINEIKACERFSPEQRAAEYRWRGKSPSCVIDGEYNDENRGNDEYNDPYRDWEANA